MKKDTTIIKDSNKQRLTAFVDPTLVKRAKVRGALEGLTISEVVEKALDAYAPKIEKRNDNHINVKFSSYPIQSVTSEEKHLKSTELSQKHTMPLGIPR